METETKLELLDIQSLRNWIAEKACPVNVKVFCTADEELDERVVIIMRKVACLDSNSEM